MNYKLLTDVLLPAEKYRKCLLPGQQKTSKEIQTIKQISYLKHYQNLYKNVIIFKMITIM
jgi:hypothetical protein